ncbi:MAG: hypothetical protein ACI85U_002236 [Candidatus Promineifilaceae bacterium]|jgi:hypothetical protein
MGIEFLAENGAAMTQFFQNSFPNLLMIMRAINVATEPEFCFLLFLAIYWGINRNKGGRYIYLLGLMLAIFSILQHILQFPAPFWLDSQIMQQETGSFASPNLNIATSLLLILPFKRFIRTDLVLLSFLLVAILTGLSQIYLGVAGIADLFLGSLVATCTILVWYLWNKRYGKAFSRRILGQRFWVAILFPLGLGLIYFVLINWVQQIGFTGFYNVDPLLYWRAWQTGFINTITALTLLIGIGIGLTIESARVGFRPITNLGNTISNWTIGFLFLGGILYIFRIFLSKSTLLQTGDAFAIPVLVIKCLLITSISIYIIPWIFTIIGTATAEAETIPTISLNNFYAETKYQGTGK